MFLHIFFLCKAYARYFPVLTSLADRSIVESLFRYPTCFLGPKVFCVKS
nr:MAG TPA: hypothetical protein [Caudoviricetes sp.]